MLDGAHRPQLLPSTLPAPVIAALSALIHASGGVHHHPPPPVRLRHHWGQQALGTRAGARPKCLALPSEALVRLGERWAFLPRWDLACGGCHADHRLAPPADCPQQGCQRSLISAELAVASRVEQRCSSGQIRPPVRPQTCTSTLSCQFSHAIRQADLPSQGHSPLTIVNQLNEARP